MQFRYLPEPTILVFLVSAAQVTHGLWTSSRLGTPSRAVEVEKRAETAFKEDFGDRNQDFMSPAERNSIFRDLDRMDEYERKPDCFRDVAGLLKGKGELGESDRIAVAISLSLCEIATAEHHSIPLECTPFTTGHHSADNAGLYQSSCVEALSRSAQHWSSYSGYLREIPQLCFAFQRLHDLDTAKMLYRNATLEKTALLRFLQKRELEQFAGNEAVQAAWKRNFDQMDSVLDGLREAGKSISVSIQEEVAKVAHGVGAMKDTWDEVHIRMKRDFRDAFQDLQMHGSKAVEMASDMALARAEVELKSAVEKYTLDLSNAHIRHFELALADSLSAVVQVMVERTGRTLEVMDALHTRTALLNDQLDLAEISLRTISAIEERVLADVQGLNSAALQNQAIVNGTLITSASLSDSLTTLLALSIDELHAINVTAQAVKLEIAQKGSGSKWRDVLLPWALESILQVDPSRLYAFLNLPLIQLSYVVLRITWEVVQFILSAGMSWALLIRGTVMQRLHNECSPTHEPGSRNEFGTLLSGQTAMPTHQPLVRSFQSGYAPDALREESQTRNPGMTARFAQRRMPRISPRLCSRISQ